MAVEEDLYSQRGRRAREEMAASDVDLLLIAPSSDLRYLTGKNLRASERPTLLALTRDKSLVLVPAFEPPALSLPSRFQVITYEEAEDPFLQLITHLPWPGRVAISDQAWAAVLLGLQRVLPEASFFSATPMLRALRMVKSREELDRLRQAARGVDRAFEAIITERFSAKTEQQLAAELGALVQKQGLEQGNWGPIVAAGSNSAFPHHATSDREIQEGDAVLLDFGGTLDGYQADTTRTVHVGEPSSEFRRAYETVQRAQDAAVHAVRPDVPAEEIDRAAREVIEDAGLGENFTHRTGHGIGLDGHEEPYIVEGNRLALEPGMTFSVEPGVYLGGRFGVRIEDIVAVTDDGVERLNEADRALKIVS